MLVFKVFPLDRAQQRCILVRNAFLSGLWHQVFHPVQGPAASSSVSSGHAGEGFFRTFPRGQESAEVASQVGADMPRHVSSWTPAACEDLEAADEPAELEEDVELLIEEEEDPSGWYVSQSASGRTFYWHRSSRRPLWHLPPGPPRGKGRGRSGRRGGGVSAAPHAQSVPLRLQARCTWQSCSVS